MPLVFEQARPTYPGLRGDDVLHGASSPEEAAEHLTAVLHMLPPGPGENERLNLGCGPEPSGLNELAIRVAAASLLSYDPGEAIPESRIDLAKRSRAWFYWRYAVKLAARELTETLGEDAAFEAIHGDDRAAFHTLRREKFRWVMRERFGFEFPEIP